MAEHRVSVLTPLRRHKDPSTSRDPRIRSVVAALEAVEPAPPPAAPFRAELRAQLVAVGPRIIAEGRTDTDQQTGAATGAAGRTTAAKAGRLARLRSIPLARPLGIVAGVVTALVLLLGGAVWMSQKSLPGDTLYGLKRASENVQISLASGDVERAQHYLDFAGTRVDEATALVSRSSAIAGSSGVLAESGISTHTAGLITSTLASADSDVMSASTLLGGQAVKTGSTHPLATLTDWAPGQIQRLDQLASAMPAGALRNRTAASAKLVHAALARAKTLQTKVGCSCLNAAGTDELGPKPCPVCTTKPARPGHHPGKTSGRTTPVVPFPRGTGGTAPGPNPAPGGNGTKATGPTDKPSPLPSLPNLPTPTLPTLPKPSKSLPIGSCGVSLSLGPINIQLGSCPPRR